MTKTQLTEDSIFEFRERFRTFHDAVIHRTVLDLFGDGTSSSTRAVIILGVIDGIGVDRTYNWINVTLEIQNLDWFSIRQPPRYKLGVVFKLDIDMFNNQIYVDLLGWQKKPTKEDYLNNLKSLESNFVVVGETCFWSTSKYTTTKESTQDILEL